MTDSLRHGDRTQAVRSLQQRLNRHGATLVIDGYYGDVTESAVRAFQLRVGLVADGIAGHKTHFALVGGDCRRLLKHADLVSAAQRLNVPLASVYALNEVASRGLGFLDNGKPLILFERHVFYQQLATPRQAEDDPVALRHHADQLVDIFPALVNPQPGAYAGGTAEHQRLHMARRLDNRAALEACAWGAFQILGAHWQRLGYTDIEHFVGALGESESQQFEAFIRFIETDLGLFKALKARKWAEFANGYMGRDYRRQLYDIQLHRAYERYAVSDLGQTVTA